MIVAVALFAIVMLVSVAALIALIDANRKARALESVINNLNISLDGMVRGMRMGSLYHCGSGDPLQPQDCAVSGSSRISFLRYGGSSTNQSDYVVYTYDAIAKRLFKAEGIDATPLPITAPEIAIDDMKFFVVGSTRGDTVQPKVVLTVKGTAGASRAKTKTTFSIQATATQRLLDL